MNGWHQLTRDARLSLIFATAGVLIFGGVGVVGVLLPRSAAEPLAELLYDIINRGGGRAGPYHSGDFPIFIGLCLAIGVGSAVAALWLLITRSRDDI